MTIYFTGRSGLIALSFDGRYYKNIKLFFTIDDPQSAENNDLVANHLPIALKKRLYRMRFSQLSLDEQNRLLNNDRKQQLLEQQLKENFN